jgi:hypothetical protein
MFDRPTRHGYSATNVSRQFHAKLVRARLFPRCALDAERTRELSEQMRAAGLASGSITEVSVTLSRFSRELQHSYR